MLGVLIVAHGSRKNSADKTVKEVCAQLCNMHADMMFEVGYLEFSEDDIENGAKKLIDRGAENIRVIPYFLFDGVHTAVHIKAKIDELIKEYPTVAFSLAKAFGLDKRITEILSDKIYRD